MASARFVQHNSGGEIDDAVAYRLIINTHEFDDRVAERVIADSMHE
jgi:hypothetical protein